MHWLAVPSANLHTTFDLIFTTFSLHHLFAPRTSWCVEPVSNEAFYYLNPDCTLPPSLSPTACILPFTLHLAAACCFCWRGREHDSSGKNLSQTKIPSLSLSLRLPGEVEEWKVPRPSLSAEGGCLRTRQTIWQLIQQWMRERELFKNSQTIVQIVGQKWMNHCVYYKVLNRAGTSVSVTKKHIYNLKMFHMTFEMSPCALTYIYIFFTKAIQKQHD